MLNKDQKTEIIKQFQKDEKDTGSPEVQIAILTQRIKELTEHLKANKKDHSWRYWKTWIKKIVKYDGTYPVFFVVRRKNGKNLWI